MLAYLLLLFALDRDIVEELNTLRSNPAKYTAHLESRLKHYRGKVLRLPKQVPLLTKEGAAAVHEAVRVLRATPPLPELENDKDLARAALRHVRDIGPKGLMRHSDVAPGVGEVISFGPDNARDVIVELLIDDGVTSRGHRKLMLDRRFRSAGAACGPHAIYRTTCVIDLSVEADPTQAQPKRR
jgi:uncharacterized protein YkwD